MAGPAGLGQEALAAETRRQVSEYRARRPNEVVATSLLRARETTDAIDAEERRWADVLGELRATKKGRELGKAYAGDPWRCVSALDVPVRRVDQLLVENSLGMYWKAPLGPLIQILDGQSPPEEARTLAHELGHHVLATQDQRCADAFMKAFLAEAPS